MWTSALGHEHGARDYASKALGGLVFREEEEEDEEAAAAGEQAETAAAEDKMEQSDDDDEDNDDNAAATTSSAPPMMPEPHSILLYSADKQHAEFPLARIPRSCAVLSPGQLKGLYAIQDLTVAHKRAVCGVLALPMLVPVSPAVAFCMRKTGKGAQARRPAAIQSWVLSAGSARQLVLAVTEGLVAFHASVKPDFIKQCYKQLADRINCYEHTTFRQGVLAAATLDDFVVCTEAAGFYYLHVCEEFLFRTLIEPHPASSTTTKPITLAEVLTPRVSYALNQCATQEARATARKCVGDFFAIKSASLATKYNDALAITPPDQAAASGAPIYKDLVPQQTLQDYWALCKYIFSE